MTLRPYQTELVEAVHGHMAFSYVPLCLYAPTGSGKTVIAANAIADLVAQGKFVVFMVNISDLVDQTSKALKAIGIPHNFLSAKHDKKMYDPRCMVAIGMQQTMHSRIDKLNVKCDVLFVDEMHKSHDTSTMMALKKKLNPQTIIGLSATPIDERGMALRNVEVVQTTTVRKLTGEGYLCPVKTYVGKYAQNIDLSEIGNGADYTESEIDEAINNDPYNQSVVDSWNAVAGGKKTIVFVSSIDHAQKLTQSFIENGIDSFCVHSKMPDSAIDSVMTAHRSGLFNVLVSVSKLTTGFDDSSIECAICCRPTKLLRLYLQMVGRITRISEGKEKAIWLDMAQVTTEHGFYDEDFKFDITDMELLKIEKAKHSKKEITYHVSNIDGPFHATAIDAGCLDQSKKKLENDESLPAIKTRYEMSDNIGELLMLACKASNLLGNEVSAKSFDWMLEILQTDSAEFGVRVFKTRMFNILTEGKKLTSIAYFGKFLRENKRY